MDDLNGLSWSNGSSDTSKPPPMSSGSLFSTMRASPLSGRSTPLSAQMHASTNPPSKPATPANDSFASLVSFGNANSSDKNLSLLEQQKKLQEQKARQEIEKRKQFEAQYGSQDAQFWDSLGRNGSTTTSSTTQSPHPPASADEDDLLAAFNASAPVDASTNFPIPSNHGSSTNSIKASTHENNKSLVFDDDDPFGLGQLPSKPTTAPFPLADSNDDDDFLGLLGKPVSELPPTEQKPTAVSPAPVKSPNPDDPRDRAIAELVDMGFPPDKAAQALETTDSGLDVQAAVGWLLNQAHSESRQKARTKAGLSAEESHIQNNGNGNTRDEGAPSWMKGGDSRQLPERRADSKSPASRDRDVGEMASNFGNQLFKTANSLWKTGSKKVQQAVHDFNAEPDPSRPRWMREASPAKENVTRTHQTTRGNEAHGREEQQLQKNVTDEALLLESDAGRSTHPTSRRPVPAEIRSPQRSSRFADSPIDHHEAKPSIPRQQREEPRQHQQPQGLGKDLKSQLNRNALEEQSAQAYVSPARRRRPTPSPQPQSEQLSIDLFDNSKPLTSISTSSVPARSPPKTKPPAPLPSRPKVPTRNIPQVSPLALSSFHKDRERGNEAYKRGDFATAHDAFTKALSHLPNDHPVTILALSNRAMTALRIGEPKVAISDAEIVLAYIGPSKGEGENIELGNGQAAKPMKDFFGKALMRKAEALENLEKWTDAAQTWRQAVETGHGGSTSIEGRNRCEKAAGLRKPTPTASRSSTPRAAQVRKPQTALPRSARSDLGSSKAAPTAEAVTRLRAANAAAERADEEKLALTDSVDARIAAWKDGKQDNLRALLSSLDNVLWAEAGWKKIGLSELVLPNKVKIQYMKGIAKVHPDKIPTDATTEQRMIAGAVFSSLNEAWDKFRKENNL